MKSRQIGCRRISVIATLVIAATIGMSPLNAAASAGAAHTMSRSAVGSPSGPLLRPRLQTKLTASDGATSDGFGTSLAMSATSVVVGAVGANAGTGAAYVFVRSGRTWSQQAELIASDATVNDNFGWSVATVGSTALVGALGKNSGTGAAYVFVRSGTKWTEQAKLVASDAAVNDTFGWSVALSGSTALVGAPGKNSRMGAAYVFVRSGTTWTEQQKLTASDGAANDDFGLSVAISRPTAAVGAFYSGGGRGATYLFVQSGSTWTQGAKITTSDSVSGFSSTLLISGSTLVVTAFAPVSIGTLYIYVGSGTLWSLQAKLTASDGATDDNFGHSVALSANTLVVGAPYKHAFTGKAYVFIRSGTTWTEQAKFVAVDRKKGDEFGSGVGIVGSTALVGAPRGGPTSAGTVYVYRLS